MISRKTYELPLANCIMNERKCEKSIYSASFRLENSAQDSVQTQFSFQIWSRKSTLVLLILAVSCNGFRFQTEESETTEEKLTGVETVEKVDPEPIVPEYEDDETEAKSRQEKKIDPLVVDVERKPIDENTDGEPKDPSEQEVEGRFFLKDKLCALGLADVSS